jgi:hypothetical protein
MMGDATEPSAPVSAPTKVDIKKGRWFPVSTVPGLISIKGGYNSKAETATTIEYEVDGVRSVYVQLDKNAIWFLKGVGGTGTYRGGLQSVTVIELLRTWFAAGYVNSAVADSQSQSESQESDPMGGCTPSKDEADPMDGMDDEDSGTLATPHGNKSASKQANAQAKHRSSFLELEVPTKPPCAGCGGCGTTTIWVHQPKGKTHNSKIYLRADGLGWLLAYAADELQFMGVDQPLPDPVANLPNCSHVADLHLQLDFQSKSWTAEFVAGALMGTSKRMSLHDINEKDWAGLKQESSHCVFQVDGDLRDATPRQRKAAVKELITAWCAAAVRTLWEATSSPPHGNKRALEEDAVATGGICHTPTLDSAAVAAEGICHTVALDAAVAAVSLDVTDAQ